MRSRERPRRVKTRKDEGGGSSRDRVIRFIFLQYNTMAGVADAPALPKTVRCETRVAPGANVAPVTPMPKLAAQRFAHSSGVLPDSLRHLSRVSSHCLELAPRCTCTATAPAPTAWRRRWAGVTLLSVHVSLQSMPYALHWASVDCVMQSLHVFGSVQCRLARHTPIAAQ